VVRAMEAAADPAEESTGSSLGRTIVRPLWQEIQEDTMRRLDEVTLDDLCRRAQSEGIPREAGTGADFSI